MVYCSSITYEDEVPDGEYCVNLVYRKGDKIAELDPAHVDAARYKPRAKKVHPVATTVPEDKQLVVVTPPVVEMGPREPRLTDERLAELNVGDGWITPAEEEYFRERLKEVDGAFAFTDQEMGLLKEHVEPPIRIPTVAHTPWNYRSYPLPRGLYDKVIELLKSKMEAGVIEPSIGSYANRWFVIAKKDKSKLR
ncbi:hypothetical protein GQ54DRAFT_267442, partial [Martensiomyces pterosporus]